MRHAKDSDIWTYAMNHQAIIVSKDGDFVERFRRRDRGPVIVWLRIGNSANRILLAWLVPLVPTILRHIEAGDRLIEVR